MCSGVAQLAERVAVNHHVVGSSPTAGAKSILSRPSVSQGVAISCSAPTTSLGTHAARFCPGVVKGVGYGPAIELFRDHMEFLSPGDKEWLFAKTAQSIYEFGEK